jgi:allantoin racemase
MVRVLVIVPFPFDESGLDKRRDQLNGVDIFSEISFDYRGVKASPALFDSYHDWLLADAGIFEAGLDAQRDGYDAVCVDTTSDSGVNALRSVLNIPVVGPAKASYLTALMLGSKFSILTQWDPWIPESWKTLQEYGLADKCASVRSINVHPDVENLMSGREQELFPALLEAARACITDGADVICLGSTTMHQAHAYLSGQLDVPVINPGPLTYKLAELFLALGLTHSRRAYGSPHVPKGEMIHAMLRAAAESERASSQDSDGTEKRA